jgi:hypothetical protein
MMPGPARGPERLAVLRHPRRRQSPDDGESQRAAHGDPSHDRSVLIFWKRRGLPRTAGDQDAPATPTNDA